ncbi:MAG: PAS domain S-box protein, partial [Candidatus Omnitrophica bacterium]|nr:PAS domain S-box protein [Candidatus Omnitrophota bacterium]
MIEDASSNPIYPEDPSQKLLRESETRYRLLFENMPSGVAVYDAVNDGEDFVFRAFNAKAERIEKIKRDEVIGRRVTEVFPGVKEFGIFDVFKRVHLTGQLEYFPDRLY